MSHQHNTGGSVGALGSTSVVSTPARPELLGGQRDGADQRSDVAWEFSKLPGNEISSAPASAAQCSIAILAARSPAARTRRRTKLRAFYNGVRCGGGPPGLDKVVSSAPLRRQTHQVPRPDDEEERNEPKWLWVVEQHCRKWRWTSRRRRPVDPQG